MVTGLIYLIILTPVLYFIGVKTCKAWNQANQEVSLTKKEEEEKDV